MFRVLLIFTLTLFIAPLFGQTFELINGDTINMIDANRKRQGKWIVKAKPSKNPTYVEGQKVEEGSYKNSRKVGIWKTYYPTGKLKSEVTFVNSRTKGPYTLYYENGQIEEQGNWQRTKNTGAFKRYHPNGQVSQDFTFNTSGKREGEQKYYYPNGQVQLEGTWKGGLKDGEMKMYFENGDLMERKVFYGDSLDKSQMEIYAPKVASQDPLKKQISEGKDINVKAKSEDKPNLGGFDGNGYTKLYNTNKQITKDGTFKNYRLMDGKFYRYNEDGILYQIMIFKNGRYIGDGIIED